MSDPSTLTAELPSERRLVLAFGLAPLVTVPVLSIASWLIISPAVSLADMVFGYSTFFFALAGLPIAYTVELLIGLPIYLRWLHKRPHPGRVIIPVSTLLGTIVMPLVWRDVTGGRLESSMAVIGAMMGLAAAMVFVTIISLGRRRAE